MNSWRLYHGPIDDSVFPRYCDIVPIDGQFSVAQWGQRGDTPLQVISDTIVAWRDNQICFVRADITDMQFQMILMILAVERDGLAE